MHIKHQGKKILRGFNMNIKDVNSLTTMIAAKSQSMPQNSSAPAKISSVGLEFISLVNSSEFAAPANVSLSDANQVDIKPARQEIQMAEDKKAPVRENVRKEDKAEAKEPAADKNESASVDKTDKAPARDKETSTADNDEKTTSSPTEDRALAENQSSSDDNQAETSAKDNVSENGQPVSDSANTEGEGDAADSQISPQDVVALASQLLSLPQLSQMGAVTVFNAADGTYSVMTGKELAAQIEAGNIDMVPVLSADNQSDITLLPPQTTMPNAQPQAAKEGLDISSLTPVAADEQLVPEMTDTAKNTSQSKEAQILSPQNQTSNDSEVKLSAPAESKAAEQAAELSRRAGLENKAEVKVNVQEENFSYTSLRDVVVDKKALNETVSAAQNTDSGSNLSQPVQNVGSASLQTPAQQLNLFAAQSTPAGKVSAEASAPNAISGVSSVADGASSGAHQAAAAADASSVLKTAARAEADNKTSFRDVYKGMGREVVDQIKVNITKSAVKGVDKIEIQLKPEDLGHIEIKMQISKDGKLQAHIISSRAETMDMLQKEMPSLEKAFNDAGFSLEDGSLSFSFRDDNQTGRETAENQNLRSFLGDVLDKSADNENSADLFSAENWDGKSALNIRV